MQDANNPAGATGARENTAESNRGRNFTIPQPIAEEDQQIQQLESSAAETLNRTPSAAALIDSVKQFFAPCVGAVDAASVYIGNCRPSDEDPNGQGENIAEDVIMRLRKKHGGFHEQNVKRRSELLEIPTHGVLFDDDDVSAISAHTLEEMERLRLAQQGKLSNFQMSPAPIYSNTESAASNIMRPIQKKFASKAATPDGNNDISICVSVSDSSSEQGMKEEKSPETTAPPAWGSKAGKDMDFKTHRVG